MKKTFTLLALATVFTTAAFAQYDHHRDNNYGDREIAANDHRYDRDRGAYFFSAREKDMQVSAINNDYNRKIESVKHRFFMGRQRKEQIICSLEQQRDDEIRSVMAKFNDRKNLFQYRDNRGHDHDRRGNW